MRHHAERIRRIQALCAQLDLAILDSHTVQETVEALKAESGLLLDDLRPRKRATRTRKQASPSRARPAKKHR